MQNNIYSLKHNLNLQIYKLIKRHLLNGIMHLKAALIRLYQLFNTLSVGQVYLKLLLITHL